MMKCVRSGNSLKPVTDDEPLYFLVIRFIERGRDDVIFRTGDKQQGRALFLEAAKIDLGGLIGSNGDKL